MRLPAALRLPTLYPGPLRYYIDDVQVTKEQLKVALAIVTEQLELVWWRWVVPSGSTPFS